jgi:hypothetical protein
MSTVLERPRADLPDANEPTDLLSRYLHALDRYGNPEPRRHALPPGADVRSCARCGERTLFRLDPEGGWAFCTTCSRAA